MTHTELADCPFNSGEIWTQEDADIFGQLLDTLKCLGNSKWISSKLGFGLNEVGCYEDIKLPGADEFVFALVFIRKLISVKDNLFSESVKRYKKFALCSNRQKLADEILQEFKNILSSNAFVLPRPAIVKFKNGESVERTFHFIAYGCGLLHKLDDDICDVKRESFYELFKLDRKMKFFIFNQHLLNLYSKMNEFGKILLNDMSDWQIKYNLIGPHLHWQCNVFLDELKYE